MTKYDDGDDDGDNDGNKDEKVNNNAASGSGSNGPIFYLIMKPRSHLVLAEEDRATTITALWPWQHMYLRVGIFLPYNIL